MTQGVVSPPPTAGADASAARSRPTFVRQVLEPLLTVVAFVAAGAVGGWLWERWWTPTTGVVVDKTWYDGTRIDGDYLVNDFPALRGYFDAAATFVLIGVVAGLVLGVLCALLTRRSELVMLVAVAGGSVLACFVAYRLGVHLGPPDPEPLAKAADDGTVLPTALSIKGFSPFAGWTFGALVGLAGTYFVTSSVAEVRQLDHDDAEWLDRDPIG